MYDRGRPAEAEAAYRRAIELKPDYAEAHINLGNALKDQGRLAEAEAMYRRAIDLKPDFAKAHSALLLLLNYRPATDPSALYRAHREWRDRYARHLERPARPYDNTRDPERRLRVGYVSPDFRTHSVSFFFEPLLAAHDRAAVELFCYAEVKHPDDTTSRLKTLADYWRSTLGLTDDGVGDLGRADGMDVLVDLAGHTGDNRLLVFARKPAPVQVTWLGYPSTTGLSTIDCRLTDAIADPEEGSGACHSETLVRLPGGFLCYKAPEVAPEVSPLPARTTGFVTFGSFNNSSKVTPEVVAVWARIMRRIPGSHLLLKSRQFADATTRQRYVKLFVGYGIDAPRIRLLPNAPSLEKHLGTYSRVDIALDTFPYNGTTTTCEALWMGVPVITLRGDRHAGRVGASLLARVGLAELIAENEEAYVETAVSLAGDRGRLEALRTGLRARMSASPLCDPAGFARQVEAAYREMWKQWCRKAEAT